MNIYIGNLSLEVTEEELRQIFLSFGQVVSVSIMNDKYIGSGQPEAYGFVEMLLYPQGQAAINGLNGTVLGNRVLSAIEALPLSGSKGNMSCGGKRSGRFSGRFNSKVRQRRY